MTEKLGTRLNTFEIKQTRHKVVSILTLRLIMQKFLGILILGLVLFSHSASAKKTKWVTGKI